MLFDGKIIAGEILQDLTKRVGTLKGKGITPRLYVITLSNDPSSTAYIRQKVLKGEQIGVNITVDKENPKITTNALVEKIEALNNNNSVHGIIVQRPMPKHLDEEIISLAINPKKDVDGFHTGSNFGTPVALAVLEILEQIQKTENEKQKFEEWLKTKRIAVLGKGITAGGPIIKALRKIGVEPQIISSRTEYPNEILKRSDIIISAVGKPNIVDDLIIKNGAILIGVGMHKEEDGKFHGDFDEEEVKDIAGIYTPTPGGVGPVNVAMLLKNLIEAAESR